MNWNSFLGGVCSSVVGGGIIYVIGRTTGWIQFSFSGWWRYRSMFRRLRAAGLSNFYGSRADYAKYRNAPNLIDYLRTAKYSIVVAGYWMAHGNEAEAIANDIAELVRRPGNRDVTIAIIDPTGPCVSELANYLAMGQDELVSRIQSTLVNLYEARSRLLPEEQHRLKIKVYATIPIASVIILDGSLPQGRIQLDLKPYRVPRHFSFAFEITGPGHPLYELCAKAWGSLVADAADFDPKRHLTQQHKPSAAQITSQGL
jgi:hypothetical protein